MPRLTVDGASAAVLAVVLISLFNAAVRPVVLALAAPVSLILVGVLVLVLQIVSFVVIAQWAPGVHVDGFGTALVASFVYAIINTILTAILGVDSGDSYYGLLVQRLLVKRSQGHTDKPGLVILQIDGLAHPILAGRMRAGSVNTMANMVRDGSHKLSRWEAILPSMTSGSQAGILHGNNDGIPAFRWYERDREHLMASSNPVDATLIVSRISNGEGLLSNNGASICNLHDGRRDAVLPDDGVDQGRGRRDRRQQRVHVVLLQPDRLPALVHALPRRVHQGAVPGAAHAALGRPAADAPRA